MSAGSVAQAAEILLVEDSETQALQLRHMLETSGFRVSWRSTAEAALDRLNEKLPDLVIADAPQRADAGDPGDHADGSA